MVSYLNSQETFESLSFASVINTKPSLDEDISGAPGRNNESRRSPSSTRVTSPRLSGPLERRGSVGPGTRLTH